MELIRHDTNLLSELIKGSCFCLWVMVLLWSRRASRHMKERTATCLNGCSVFGRYKQISWMHSSCCAMCQ